MIDLHCHMLPAIDDGAVDMDTALEMARIAAEDGIATVACTPHIYPGLYDNTSDSIRHGVARLREALDAHGINLQLSHGADAHLVPELLHGLRNGTVPTLNGSRYFLLEFSHHTAPRDGLGVVFQMMSAGYVPVITHPERLRWIEYRYEDFVEMARQGAWMQLTAGSLTGRFGRRARYWAERMLDDGIVHLLATDAHNVRHRRPLLAEGRDAAARIVGAEEAERLVLERPAWIMADGAAEGVAPPPGLVPGAHLAPGNRWRRLYRRLFA